MELSRYKRINGYYFEHKDGIYAYDIEELVSFKINKRYYEIFKQLHEKQNKFIKLTEEEILDINGLIKKDFIFKRYEEEELTLVNKKREGRVSFAPTHRCNFRCVYCFADAGNNYKEEYRDFDEKSLIEMLDYLYRDYFKDYSIIRFDFVSGGEPLLRFDIIQRLRELTKQYDIKYNKSSIIWLCTNGYLLDDKKLEYIQANKIGLGISYEGSKEYHDELRVLENGKGTYDIVTEKITSIVKNPNLHGTIKNFWCLGVITSKMPSIKNIIKHHQKAKIKNLQLKLARLSKESEYAITLDNLEEIKEIYSDFTEFLIEEITHERLDTLLMILNKNDLLGKILLRLTLQKKHIRRCGAGVNKISVCANGDIYPCDSFVGKKVFKMGNVKYGIDEKRLDESTTIYRSPKCKECWIRYLCGGDCYHNALMSSNNIYHPDTVSCEINRHIAKLAIVIYDYITEQSEDIKNQYLTYATIKYSHQ